MRQQGFTLIELVLFILVTSLLISGIMLGYIGALNNYPVVLQNTIAMQSAKQCAQWYLGQRRLNGYSSISGANCTNPLTLPSICFAPTGYNLTGTCSQTTLHSGDTNYETITITTSGKGDATVTLLVGNYG